MQAYHNQTYYAPHPQYASRQPHPQQPGTYLTGFSATYPQFVQPQLPPGAQGPAGYQQFPAYPQEQYEPYPQAVVPDRRRDRDRERERPDKYGMNRSHSLAVPNPNAVPLKSALKKRPHDRSASMGNVPMQQQPSMSRTSSRAPSEARERTTSTGRRRVDSMPHKYDHIFLTFPSSNEVRVENCDFHTVEELRQNVLPSWPAGVGQEGMSRHEPIWSAQFNGAPWATSSTSSDSIIARRMICSIYAVMASQGYAYIATASTSNPPAKLIFSRGAPEQLPLFFTISVSTSGSKLSILDAPAPVIDSLGHQLRSYFPRLIDVNRTTADGETRIQIGRGNNSATEADKLSFSSHVLGFLNSLGFKLDGSIPMGKAGPLGFGSRKEMWVFRATQARRPPSAHGRNREGSMNGQNGQFRDGSTHGHGSMPDHDDQY
ncbi:hypothetical protein BC835DRAFT_1355983 [Cytidiella melzeri]|nr:hypothetical protein BC835DRAFT_1355983 [Cytidiella melzeri]